MDHAAPHLAPGPVVFHPKCARGRGVHEKWRTASGGTIEPFFELDGPERVCSICKSKIARHDSMFVDTSSLPSPTSRVQDRAVAVLRELTRPLRLAPDPLQQPRLSPFAGPSGIPRPLQQLLMADMILQAASEIPEVPGARALALRAADLVARLRARVAAGPESDRSKTVVSDGIGGEIDQLLLELPHWDVRRSDATEPFRHNGMEYAGFMLRSSAVGFQASLAKAHGGDFMVVRSDRQYERPEYVIARWF